MATIDTSKSIVQGQNWGVFGKMNTGKTFTALMLAFALSEESKRRIIVYDHARNNSYKEIRHIVPVERIQYNLEQEFGDEPIKVQPLTHDIDTEFNNFCHYCVNYVRNSIIILDDSGEFLSGNFDNQRRIFIKQTKNNHNDVFFQAHSFREVGPALLENLQMLVIKELSNDNIPTKLPQAKMVEKLHNEVIQANLRCNRDQQWNYIIYDVHKNIVFKENKKGVIKPYEGREYFAKN